MLDYKAKSFKIGAIVVLIAIVLIVGYVFSTGDMSREDVAKKVLTRLYTVEDYNELEKMQKQQFESATKEEMIELSSFGTYEYLSEKSKVYLARNRPFHPIRHVASRNKITIKVKDINLKKSSEIVEENIIGYIYEVDIEVTSADQSVKTTTLSGFINVQEEDGKFKCGVIEPNVRNIRGLGDKL